MAGYKKSILIIGAGPAGLSAAYHAQKEGYNVIIIERENFVGGKGASIKEGDFIVDFGPHAYKPSSKAINQFIKTHSGNKIITLNIKQKLIIAKKIMSYPFNIKDAIFKLNLLLNIKILLDYFYIKIKNIFCKPDLTSFKSWGITNFGRTLYEIGFGQYSERVWNISTDKISAEFAKRKLPSYSLLNIIMQIIFKKKIGGNIYLQTPEFWYHQEGIGQIYKNIADGIIKNGGKIIFRSRIKELEMFNNKISSLTIDEPHFEKIKCDYVISTIPVDDLVKYLLGAENSIISNFQNLPFRDYLTLNVILKRKQFSDAHCIYLVNSRFKFNRLSEQKNFSEYCAPKDKTLITFEITCDENDEKWNWSAEMWKPYIINELKWFKIDPQEIEKITINKIKKAYPLFLIGYEENKRTILSRLAKINNLVSTGRYGLFLDIDMHDSMVLGREGFKYLVSGDLETFYKDHEMIYKKRD